MACYNEVGTIAEIVKTVKNCPYQDKEIVVVDNCSTDGTREKIKNEIEGKVDKVVYHDRNQGKGAASRTRIKAATGDIIIIQDADLEANPNEIPKVIQPILDGKADVIYGSRFLRIDAHEVIDYWHKLGNKVLTTISNLFSGIDLTDMETCYKAFKSRGIQRQQITK
jgi:glycosyltransferase involved in cell wall biosynthesis